MERRSARAPRARRGRLHCALASAGKPGAPDGIAALVRAHETFAGGATSVAYVDDDLYIMVRLGHGAQRGLVFVLDNAGDGGRGRAVATPFHDQRLRPVAWWSSSDGGSPAEKTTDGSGHAELWAPPRGYVVYAPS